MALVGNLKNGVRGQIMTLTQKNNISISSISLTCPWQYSWRVGPLWPQVITALIPHAYTILLDYKSRLEVGGHNDFGRLIRSNCMTWTPGGHYWANAEMITTGLGFIVRTHWWIKITNTLRGTTFKCTWFLTKLSFSTSNDHKVRV